MPDIYLRAAQTSPAEDIWLYDTKAGFSEPLSVFMHSNAEVEGEATNDVILYSSNDWVPVDAPDLKLWLRADMAFALDDFGVSTWRDMSGNGEHAQDVGGSIYQGFGVFGKGSMVVPVASSFTLPTLGTTGGPCTLAVVYRTTTAETGARLIGWNGSTGTNTVDVGTANIMRTSFALSATGASSARVGHSYGADSRSHVDVMVFDGLAASTVPSSYTAEVDGYAREELASTSLTNTITPGILTSHVGEAQIAEVLVYDRDLRGQELADLKAYLAARYVWKPTDLAATCILWLRGDLGSQGPTYWGDQSGNGNHATQVAGAPYEPSVGTNLINGRATARFGNVNAFYDIPVLFCASVSWTQFVVYKLDSALGASQYGVLLYWLDTNNADSPNVMFLAEAGTGYTPMTVLAEYTGTVASVGYGTSATYDANPHIGQVSYDGGTNTSPASYTARQDWISSSVSTSLNSAPVTGKVGGDGLGNGIIGEIAEVIIYDGVLSEADMLSVTEYLELRYNLVSTTGTGSGTISPLVASGAGNQSSGATGTGSGTLSPLVAASTGAETFTGTGSGTLSPLVAASSGAETFTGTGSGTLSPLVAASTGAETMTGTGSGTLSPLVASGAGGETFTGTGSGTISPLVAASSGAESFTGTGSGTISPLVASGAGAETFTGTGSGTLQPLVAAGSGAETMTGTGSGTIAPLVASGAGGETFTGTGSCALSPLVAASSGAETFTGTGSCALSPLVADSSGTETITGTGSGTIQPLDTSGSGSAGGSGVTGTGSCAISPLDVAASGTETIAGTGSATIAPLVATSSGALSFVGTGSAALGPLVAAGAGVAYQNVTGTGGAVLASLDASGAGTLVITGAGSASIAPLVALGFYVAAISGLSRVVLTRSSASVAFTDSAARFTDSTSRPKVDLS